ncbi:hypothetical protein Dimus_034097 [Dionaea muscipula]
MDLPGAKICLARLDLPREEDLPSEAQSSRRGRSARRGSICQERKICPEMLDLPGVPSSARCCRSAQRAVIHDLLGDPRRRWRCLTISEAARRWQVQPLMEVILVVDGLVSAYCRCCRNGYLRVGDGKARVMC